MYIEKKSDGLSGPARIGRVTFSKSGRSIHYRGRMFQSLNGSGFKANYFDTETGEEYWISGCKKSGRDRLYGGTVEIDDDVREEYWTIIRKLPSSKHLRTARAMGNADGNAATRLEALAAAGALCHIIFMAKPSKREFSVIVERDEQGYYVASVPELPGCHTQARSLDKLMDRVREAIELCLEHRTDKRTSNEFIGIQRVAV